MKKLKILVKSREKNLCVNHPEASHAVGWFSNFLLSVSTSSGLLLLFDILKYSWSFKMKMNPAIKPMTIRTEITVTVTTVPLDESTEPGI